MERRDPLPTPPLPTITEHASDDAGGLALRLAHARLRDLAHPHLARALAAGRDDTGAWWATREALAPVGSLVDAADLALWLPGWLAGLGALHAAGIVHGALRPEAFGLDDLGTPRLADIGRGWRIGQVADGALPTGARPFAAPEVLAEGRVDARTDLYAVGALCHWWLLGEAPSADADLLAENLGALPAPWSELIGALIRPYPARRPASVTDALAPLGACTDAPAPSRQNAPLVGRRAELERLLAVADEVAEVGAGHIVAISGPAGTGKSRLMAELRHRLLARGWGALVGRQDGRTAGAPYGAWHAIVARLLAQAGPVACEAAPVVAAILPGSTVAQAAALAPRAEMLRLCRAIASLVEEAAASAPLVICVEDWHAADPASRELLAYLDRALPAVPYMIVVATRDAATGEGADPVKESVPLGPLGDGDARSCWRGAFGGDQAATWDVVLDETAGNPGMLDALADACAPHIGPARRSAGAVLAALAPAPTLPTLWTQRLAGASPAARALAAAAAVVGLLAGLALLGQAARLEGDAEDALLAAAQELITLGALVPEGEGLTLAAPAEAALADDDADDVRARHASALAYWRAAAQLGREVAPALLARHALASGDPAAGLWYATAAARAALGLYALTEAEAWLAGASDRLATLPEAPGAWRLALAEALGDLARYRARGVEAEASYRTALDLAEAAEPHQAARLRTSLAIALSLATREDEAGRLFEEATADTRAPEAARLRAATYAARHAVRHGRADAAIALARGVVDHPAASPLLRCEALGLLGLIHATVPGQPIEAGLAHLEQARAMARESGDRLALLNASMLSGNALYALGRLRHARASFERYALLCQELGLPDEAACATLNLAQVAFAQGRFQEAWDRARSGATAAGAIGNKVYEAFGWAYAGVAGCHLGQIAEAERALATGAAIARDLGGYMRAQVDIARLEALIFLGRFGRAEELGHELAGLPEVAEGEFQGTHALLMAQLYELAGEVDTATEYMGAARKVAEVAGNATLLASVHLGAAQVALRAGQLALAEARGADALTAAESVGAMLSALRAHLLLARVRWSLGRPTEASGHLATAGTLARDLGSPHWQAMVWQTTSRFADDAAGLRHKAAAYLHFYTNQLPPLARQEFLRWPDRRDAFSGRATGALEAIVPRAPIQAPPAKEARA